MTPAEEGVVLEVMVLGVCGSSRGGAKGRVVVTGAEIQLRRQGRQRFNLLKGDFNCYTAN